MSWLTAIGTAIVSFFTALPKIIEEIQNWRKSNDIKRQEDMAKKIDEIVKETTGAKSDEERKKSARKISDLIRDLHK